MMTIEIPEELDARLRNWGNWCRPTRSNCSSPLAKVLRELGVPEDRSTGHVDVKDAEQVNMRWRQMPFGAYEDRKVKLLVSYAYTYNVNAQTILRLIRRQHHVRINPGEYDDVLQKGIRILGRKLGYVIH